MQPLYLDEHLLVLNKPAGLLCVPGKGPDKQDCLSARAQALWPDALVVHRLDQATSGLVLMARSAAVQRLLSSAFAERHIHKTYLAVVSKPLMPDGPSIDGWHLIDLPIAADWPRRPLRVIDAVNGKPAQTLWRHWVGSDAATLCAPVSEAIASAPTCRLVLRPLTGRTHQLRVHLQALGSPIAGDTLYGDPVSPDLMPARMLLHACQLQFTHPATGQAIDIACPAPF